MKINKKYLIYHIRWQSGIIIMFPITYLFIDILKMPTWLYCFLFNIVGACIYWYVDKYIFLKNK